MQEQEEERAGAKAELPFLQGKLGGRMMSNMKIGEIRAFKCVEAKDEHNRCDGCMFCDDEDFCWADEDISGHCSTAFRDDKKDVIFVSTDPNEIIRERIEKSIDGLSGGDDDKKENLSHLEKKLPVCPICGHKAFIFHDVVDGADMGYSSGCPVFRLYDKKHGIVDLKDPRAPKFSGFTAKEAYDKWIEYCRRMNGDAVQD